MTETLTLTPAQIAYLAPLFAARTGNAVLVANIFPTGPGWALTVHCLPAERREAIREACAGRLKLPRKRKSNNQTQQHP